MIRWVAILVFSIAPGQAGAQNANDLHLRGKPKNMHETVQQQDGNKLSQVPGGHQNCNIVFNRKGLVTERITFYQGIQTEKTQLFYDSLGHEIKAITCDMQERYDTSFRTNTYDAQNRIISSTSKRNGEEEVNLVMTYDKHGHVSRQVYQNYTEVVFSYDSLGRRTGHDRYRPNGKHFSANTYTYDEQGRVIQCVYKNLERNEQTVYYLKYNTSGDVSQSTVHEKGMKTVYTCRYVYDSHGNWTQKTISVNAGPGWVVKRQFEYFE